MWLAKAKRISLLDTPRAGDDLGRDTLRTSEQGTLVPITTAKGVGEGKWVWIACRTARWTELKALEMSTERATREGSERWR